MKDYPVPAQLRDMEEMDTDITVIQPQLAEPLSLDNYQDVFSTLLWLEEIVKEREIRKHDLTSVILNPAGAYLGLTVPGLAEGRPKLLIGDKVIICRPGGTDSDIHYEGIIHKIYGEDIQMQFNQEVQEDLAGEECDVMFTFNRCPLRRMHHAADIAIMLGAQVLFPTCPTPMPPLMVLDSIPFYNSILNDRQRSAVTRIVGARCRPMPYVLFGPPGTGKTITVVESILQILFQCASSRILACAPSNSAVDLLATRLHDSGQIVSGMMVRLNALSRSTPPPPSILQYCVTPDQAAIAVMHRIVLCTCVSAGTLHTLGLAPGHFSHVFVDEAGQAAEPECLIPISLLVGSSQGQMVFAGDPMQLGPMIGSRLAGRYGLETSLLERLMERQPYKRDPRKFADHGNFDPLVVTKLVDNYRAHGLLVRLYSEQFYDGELLERASQDKTHCLCSWDKLPKKGVPLVFHGVLGEEMREAGNPSWFNPVEVVQVIQYTQALVDNSSCSIRYSDIGIITPYRKQVEKIRILLKHVGLEDIKVGSVEEFQGQERLVIIISTVRSSNELLSDDMKYHLGFLANPKRFNVAISRAQALLIVIGNPYLLTQDLCWHLLIKYAQDNGGYTGCPLLSSNSGALL